MLGSSFNILQLVRYSILGQLRIEEALLRGGTGNWMILNHGTPSPTIVMGLSGNPTTLLHVEKVKEAGVEVIRRCTGGGTVVVDEDTLFVSLIGDEALLQEHGVKLYPREMMKWTERFYKKVFMDEDFVLMENDYVFGKKKFGGNAQCITKKRWLHHTSMLHDYQDHLMEMLQMPVRKPEYREKRTHKDFLCKLKERYPSVPVLSERFVEAWKNLHRERTSSSGMKVEVVDVLDIPGILALPHEPTTTLVDLNTPSS